MRVSEHMARLHKTSQDHHTAMIAAHTDALEKADMKDEKGKRDSAFHKAAVESHEKMRDFHAEGLAECTKAIGDSLDKIAPDNVRGVITHFPNITAVPRTGQRQIEKSEVPLELEKVLSMDLE